MDISIGHSDILITNASRPKRVTYYTWLLIGGISSSVFLITFTLVITYVEVADVVAISYGSLIFVPVLACNILKEPFQRFVLLFSFLVLSGVIFIARPHPMFVQTTKE